MFENMEEGNTEIKRLLLMYPFHEHAYSSDHELPTTVDEIIQAITTGWITVYGIQEQPDKKYTIAFADENSNECYLRKDFTESELLQICETEYKNESYV